MVVRHIFVNIRQTIARVRHIFVIIQRLFASKVCLRSNAAGTTALPL